MNLERFRSQEGSWICSSDDRRRLRARDEANAMGYREPYVNWNARLCTQILLFSPNNFLICYSVVGYFITSTIPVFLRHSGWEFSITSKGVSFRPKTKSKKVWYEIQSDIHHIKSLHSVLCAGYSLYAAWVCSISFLPRTLNFFICFSKETSKFHTAIVANYFKISQCHSMLKST